jgi:hypothetical protein
MIKVFTLLAAIAVTSPLASAVEFMGCFNEWHAAAAFEKCEIVVDGEPYPNHIESQGNCLGSCKKLRQAVGYDQLCSVLQDKSCSPDTNEQSAELK